MDIRIAAIEDLTPLSQLDGHIRPQELRHAVSEGRVLLAEEQGRIVGWLRWGLFWDSVPFLNMLYVLDGERRHGVGQRLMARWEAQMLALGHDLVMTSTAADEYAQHFYHKLGYETVGGFFHRDDPYELILSKRLTGGQ